MLCEMLVVCGEFVLYVLNDGLWLLEVSDLCGVLLILCMFSLWLVG